jgi:methylenetetrahydrofolate--tRNA-(uracil-5-)-methyltransferase
MRPDHPTPAHTTDRLAELCGSNNLRSEDRARAVGLLHEEMRRTGSLVFAVAEVHRVPAGRSLAVDRRAFAREITERIEGDPKIDLVREEVTSLPAGPAIVSPGPHVSRPLAEILEGACGRLSHRYHPTSPVVRRDSLDPEQVFEGPPDDEGSPGYINVPLTHERYHAVVEEIRLAETTPLHRTESPRYSEENLPIEEAVRRGRDTPRFGVMKPTGLADPRTGEIPFAVVRLRQEDRAATLYGVEGFRTRMRVREQKRILRMLPGLEKVEVACFATVSRHVFVRAAAFLGPRLEHRERPGVYFAGRILGVDGVTESAALGLMAGVNAAFRVQGQTPPLPPPSTALGALVRAVVEDAEGPPAAVSYGMFPPLETRRPRPKRRERNLRLSERALEDLPGYLDAIGATT